MNWESNVATGYFGEILKKDDRLKVAYQSPATIFVRFNQDPDALYRLTVERVED